MCFKYGRIQTKSFLLCFNNNTPAREIWSMCLNLNSLSAFSTFMFSLQIKTFSWTRTDDRGPTMESVCLSERDREVGGNTVKGFFVACLGEIDYRMRSVPSASREAFIYRTTPRRNTSAPGHLRISYRLSSLFPPFFPSKLFSLDPSHVE